MIEMGVSASTSVTLPDLTGRRILECSEILSALGLEFVPVGYGTVISQSPAGNTVVERGDKITVQFDVQNGDPIETLRHEAK